MNILTIKKIFLPIKWNKIKTQNPYFLPIIFCLSILVMFLGVYDIVKGLKIDIKLSYLIFSIGLLYLHFLLSKNSFLRENFLHSLKQNKLKAWIVLLGFLCISHFLFKSVLIKRINATALCLIVFTCHRLAFKKFLTKSKKIYTKIAHYYIVIIFFLIALPGICIPPFTSGIAGWTVQVNPEEPINLSGIKLINDTGEEVWFSNGIISPFNFMYRHLSKSKTEQQRKKLLDYYMLLYKKRFPLLAKGKFPNQKYLSRFAYPGHNPYRMLNYKDFDPESISKIQWVTEKYDPKTNKLIIKMYKKSYSLKNKTFNYKETIYAKK